MVVATERATDRSWERGWVCYLVEKATIHQADRIFAEIGRIVFTKLRRVLCRSIRVTNRETEGCKWKGSGKRGESNCSHGRRRVNYDSSGRRRSAKGLVGNRWKRIQPSCQGTNTAKSRSVSLMDATRGRRTKPRFDVCTRERASVCRADLRQLSINLRLQSYENFISREIFFAAEIASFLGTSMLLFTLRCRRMATGNDNRVCKRIRCLIVYFICFLVNRTVFHSYGAIKKNFNYFWLLLICN